ECACRLYCEPPEELSAEEPLETARAAQIFEQSRIVRRMRRVRERLFAHRRARPEGAHRHHQSRQVEWKSAVSLGEHCAQSEGRDQTDPAEDILKCARKRMLMRGDFVSENGSIRALIRVDRYAQQCEKQSGDGERVRKTESCETQYG